MNQVTNYQTKKEYQYLKQILLTNQEWDILKSLVKILLPFAEVTTFLGSSKFSMIGFINPIINTLKLGVFSNKQQDFDILEEIDFIITETPFDDNINFDDINFDELLENKLDNNSSENYNFIVEKVKIALYKALQYYWKFLTHNELLYSLLNPQYRKFEFISKSEQKLTKDILIQLYNEEQNNINYDSSDFTNNNYQSVLNNELSSNSLLKQLKAKKKYTKNKI
ncbi:15412_t:CDS:1 [Cetraspora pellucida]|uniref:15412_t:CDS:1 n=1 Tax=Cetraspora pellucida TaxID=1433469 RepID=A0A9N9EKH5_9GLOM|nr:15412_t:CDS:1 [Cetraspora pellucida]